jgi:phosphoserine phosphatase RsbU/P
MEELLLKNRFKIKELELNSLLEITQAINNNLPEQSLYKIFNFTLRGNHNVRKLALFVYDQDWSCKVNFGTEKDFHKVPLHEECKKVRTVTDFAHFNAGAFNEFDMVIPVTHKTDTLALVFVGWDHEPLEKDSINFIQALSNIIIVAIENKKLARKQLEQEAFRKELEIASDVQQYLFPEKLPYGPRLKIEASYLPHDRVGGDYYDYIPINKNQFLICVADVSGKGIPAAILMSNFQACLRTLVRQTPNLSEIVEELNYQVFDSSKGEKFITFFAGIYDHSLRTLVYVNAGHNPPFLVQKDKEIHPLTEGCTVLGAMPKLPFLNEGFLTDIDDFLLFLFTDGLTETENEEGEEFGVERLMSYFQSNGHKDLKRIHQDVIVDLDHFKGKMGFKDDITMVSCRIEP